MNDRPDYGFMRCEADRDRERTAKADSLAHDFFSDISGAAAHWRFSWFIIFRAHFFRSDSFGHWSGGLPIALG